MLFERRAWGYDRHRTAYAEPGGGEPGWERRGAPEWLLASLEPLVDVFAVSCVHDEHD